jgi:hypothetical protein
MHKKHINTLCGKNAQFLNVKSDSTYGDHCSLKGHICGRQDIASNLETADSYLATNSPDLITISGGSLVTDTYAYANLFFD